MGGVTTVSVFATDVESDNFFNSADSNKVITVKDDTVVAPPDSVKSMSTKDVDNYYSVGGYTINVQDGKSLTLKNLYMNNPDASI